MKNPSLSGLLALAYLSSWFIIGIYYCQLSGWNLGFFSKIVPLNHLFTIKSYLPAYFILSNFIYRLYHFNGLQNPVQGRSGCIILVALILLGGSLLWAYSLALIFFIWIYPISVILFGYLLKTLLSNRPGEISQTEIRIKNEMRKIENDSSFHWKTDSGIINIINPFQGILIVGAAGSGKTYTLIQEIILQSIKKGYTGFIYDYKYPELTEFTYSCLSRSPSRIKLYTVNFIEPKRSHRVNPLHPRNLPVSLFANEFATVILKNLKKEWVNKQDFWADNAIAYLKAIIWYLRKHEPKFCTLPHVIALALKDYSWVLDLLSGDRECKSMISSLWTAYQENAQSQIAGCISSLQNPIEKLNNPEIFWILTGDEVPLHLNNPDEPALLCIGNASALKESLNPIISLIASVVMKNLNLKGKEKSIFLLDEAPTLYIPDLKDLPNTGRSNRVSTVYCCQDFSQMDYMYGKEESKVLRASLGNQFFGMVNDYETSLQVSNLFGKENEMSPSKTISSSTSSGQEAQSSTGYSYTQTQKDVLKSNAALYFQPGFFVGKVTSAKKPFFSGKPQISREEDHYSLPEFRIFPEEEDLKNLGMANIQSNEKVESNLWQAQQNSVETVINWNYRRVFLEVDEILFRHS